MRLPDDATLNKQIEVWDPVLRCFHWLLVIAWLTSWWFEGRNIQLHVIAGSIIAGLLLFRLIWGMVGEHYARFSSFASSPTAIARHIRELLQFRSSHHIGHTPVGGVMIFILLFALLLLVCTGTALLGMQTGSGLFSGWAADASFETEVLIQHIHAWCFNTLLVLAGMHLAGVVVESLLQRCNLVTAMITGRKTVRETHK
jgi:cytochrome b